MHLTAFQHVGLLVWATQYDWPACADVHMQSYFSSEHFPENLPADVWEPQWAHLASAGGAAVVLGAARVPSFFLAECKCLMSGFLQPQSFICLGRPSHSGIRECKLCQMCCQRNEMQQPITR